MQATKLVGRYTRRAGLVGDEVIRTAAHECEITRPERNRCLATRSPEPNIALDHGMNRKLYARQPQPPRRIRCGTRKHAPSRTRANQMFLQEIHDMSVSDKNPRVKIIEPPIIRANTRLCSHQAPRGGRSHSARGRALPGDRSGDEGRDGHWSLALLGSAPRYR